MTVRAFDVVGPILSVSPVRTLSASAPASITSSRKPVHLPSSAMDSTPALAAPPLRKKVTLELWAAPIRREK